MADFPMPLPDGWQADGAYPANVDSKGGNLTLRDLIAAARADEITAILKRFSAAQGSNVLEIQNEAGVKMLYVDPLGNLIHDGGSAGPDGVTLGGIQFFHGVNDKGINSSFYLTGLSALLVGASIYAMVGLPWQALTAYDSVDEVIPTAPNGHAYACFASGVSGASEPTWPIAGGTVVDGTVTWHDLGVQNLTAPFAFYGPKSNDGSIIPRFPTFAIWHEQTGSLPSWGIGSYGEEQLFATPVPADADIATSERAQYYDDTPGAPKLRFKERDSAGTLFTGASASEAFAMAQALVMQQSSSGPLGSAPTLIQTGTSFAVEDEFEIIANDEVEIAAGACLAIH